MEILFLCRVIIVLLYMSDNNCYRSCVFFIRFLANNDCYILLYVLMFFSASAGRESVSEGEGQTLFGRCRGFFLDRRISTFDY